MLYLQTIHHDFLHIGFSWREMWTGDRWTRILHTHTCVLHNFDGLLFLMTNFQNRSEQDTLQSLCLQLAFGPQLTRTSPLSTINSKSLLPLAMQFSMAHLELCLAGSEFLAILLLLVHYHRCTCSFAVPVGQGSNEWNPSGSPWLHTRPFHLPSWKSSPTS